MDPLLEWLATAELATRIFGWLGLPKWAQKRLQRNLGVIMAPGFQFFPTRTILERTRDYNEFLGSASEICGIYVTGRKLWVNYIENARRINRAILPDPRSQSFKKYAKSIGEYPDLAVDVCRSTNSMRADYNIEVRWFPDMVHNSIKIGDPEKKSGWVHIETVLPYTKANMRPSVTIYREYNEDVVRDIWKSFQSMWENSTEPDRDYINTFLNSGKPNET